MSKKAEEHNRSEHPEPKTKPEKLTPKGKSVIVWDSFTGNGNAPDGSIYGIESEHIRGEGAWYWATFNGRELNHPTDPWGKTQAKAVEAAEHHYSTTHIDPSES
ncbi:hypothetical protein [Plantibacter sp. YIM 135249]|uniref:hypothetical protein n=1 Tax=Plantibacter sp. YIM 135249 TaxID=3423918 RepID=UPI003D34D6AB